MNTNIINMSSEHPVVIYTPGGLWVLGRTCTRMSCQDYEKVSYQSLFNDYFIFICDYHQRVNLVSMTSKQDDNGE